MSRDDGFARADVDTAYLDDAKWRRVWRTLKDEGRMSRAVLLHLSTMLASWRHGERVCVIDAAPTWLDIDPELVAVLADADLLDPEGCIPAPSFDGWYGPAAARKAAATEAGRTAVNTRWERARARTTTVYDRTTPVYDRDTQPTNQPYQPTNQPTERERADLEAYLAVRFRPPTPAQRTLMDAYCAVFDVTGPERAAALIYGNPADPIGALKADLDAFRKERAAAAPPEPKPRRPSVSLLTSAHNAGRHTDPVDGCPYCKAGAA
jgi:hypothetical protein